MHETFRLSKSILRQGLVCTPLFLAATIGSACVFFIQNPAKHGFNGPHSVAITGTMGVLVFGTMTLLGAYTLLAYHREWVTIGSTFVAMRSVFKDRRFDAARIDKLVWKPSPQQSRIVFEVLGQRTRIDLGNYGNDDRLRMITLLHALVAEEKQVGWPLFCYKCALPLRDSFLPAADRPLGPNEILVTRERYDRFFLKLLPLSIEATAVAWWMVRHPVALLIPVVLLMSWFVLRLEAGPEGSRQARMHWEPGLSGMLPPFAILLAFPLVAAEMQQAGFAQTAINSTCGVLIAVALGLMFHAGRKADKRRQREDEIAVPASVARWEQGEVGQWQFEQAGAGSAS
jgi:hypothetical protein